MSMTTNLSGSAALEREGTLFRLPREIRDEIYRYIVQGTHTVSRKRNWSRPSDLGTRDEVTRVRGFNPIGECLYASRAINHEAMAVLYSESSFRVFVRSEEDEAIWLSSAALPSVERMMNIELLVRVENRVLSSDSTVEKFTKKQRIWKATLGCISRSRTVRDTIRIRWGLLTCNPKEAIPEWMYRAVESLTRFRAVTIELSLVDQAFLRKKEPFDREENRIIVKDLESTTEPIMQYLERSLGPAIVSNAYDPDNRRYLKTLKFQPQKHEAVSSRGRAGAPRAEADGLDVEADMGL